MRTYRREVGPLAYASPGVILLVLGGVALLLAGKVNFSVKVHEG